jgi:hypothetical protein
MLLKAVGMRLLAAKRVPPIFSADNPSHRA